MGELTTEQIVKIVIGALVLIVVISGAYLIFKDRIHSYFSDLVLRDDLSLSIEEQQRIFTDANIVGFIKEGEWGFLGTTYPIQVKNAQGIQDTPYYFWKETGKIYKDKPGRDVLVGETQRGRIVIKQEYRAGELGAIHGGIPRNNAIYREQAVR